MREEHRHGDQEVHRDCQDKGRDTGDFESPSQFRWLVFCRQIGFDLSLFIQICWKVRIGFLIRFVKCL